MEYMEYVIKYTCSHFNHKWNFAQHFHESRSICALGSVRTLTAITRQRITYLPKMAPQIVALELLNALVFFKMQYGGFSRSGSHIHVF